jgi:hypothetical protein
MDTAENVHRNSQPLREQEATKLFENRHSAAEAVCSSGRDINAVLLGGLSCLVFGRFVDHAHEL